MKHTYILLVAAWLISFTASSQTNEEREVQAVIESLFNGMRDKNPDLLSKAFAADAIMQTVISKPEGSEVGSNSVADFIKRISETPADTHLDERISAYQIKVDGNLAAAWTPYQFFVNGSLSHCGVNSFQLVKKAEGWKIVYIIDTRRKEPCPN